MPSRISATVDDQSPVTVVRLRGDLDLVTMWSVHAVLQRCVAAQPDALVVDLAETRVTDRSALSVFTAICRQAADWPVVPTVLCSPPPSAADWLAASTACQVVPVRPDGAEVARIADTTAVPRLRVRLEPVTSACRRARDLVSDACARWNLPESAGPASLVLSELVGNVVRHAGTPMQVTLTLRRPYLHVAVADGSRRAARPGGLDLRAEGGRGLLLVRELTQRWGSAPARDGKVVWAILPAT
ncbi:ATP-binding protein [Micromonospora sp. NPDC000207]|uniref:ATP-binding protein n=1 Tax=Micromonospora sp. NPDC000207 TaxID=3154246 RepID=UPI00331E4D61